MNELFDEQELIEFVEQVLTEDAAALKPKGAMPLGFGDSALISTLSSSLAKYLPTPDVQMILSELRSELVTEFNKGTLQDLHILTKNCTRCPKASSSASMPIWNLADPDAVFLVDSPITNKSAMDYFVTEAKNAGFSSTRIAMTYINRCEFPYSDRPGVKEISNCSSYLFSELQMLQPKLIIPMGAVATGSILPRKMPLSQLRGKIHWLGPFAVLPTFGINYVMRSKESQSEVYSQDLSRAYNFLYGEK